MPEVVVAWMPAIAAVAALAGTIYVRRTQTKVEGTGIFVKSAVDVVALEQRLRESLQEDLKERDRKITKLQSDIRNLKSERAVLTSTIETHESRIKLLEDWIRAQGVDPGTIA